MGARRGGQADAPGSNASVPYPKFATTCCGLKANFGFDKDTRKSMILVWLLVQKFP